MHDFMKCIITICLVSFCFFNESYKYNDISIGILCCIAVGNHHSQSTVESFTKKNNSGFQKPAQSICLAVSFQVFCDYNLNLAFSKKKLSPFFSN